MGKGGCGGKRRKDRRSEKRRGWRREGGIENRGKGEKSGWI